MLAALAVGHCYNADPSVAARHLDRAEELAEATGDPEVIADALMGRLITYSGVATSSGDILDWARRLNTLQHSGFREDQVIAHSVCTMAAMNLGDVAGAERHLQAGIEGSEQLQLPVLRAQLRWMEAVTAVWRGDFAEADRHHGIAAHVHEQTELYGAGSALMAAVSLVRETGGDIDPAWRDLAATPETGGQSMIDLVNAALLTVAGGSEVAPAAEALLSSWLEDRDRPHVWTTLGHLVLLAHLAADGELVRFGAPLLTALMPFADRITVIGQIGVAGPVALATARLRALTGDADGARVDLDVARDLAARTGGAPSAVRCALVSAELIDDPGERAEAAAAVLADAEALGMLGVVKAASRLL